MKSKINLALQHQNNRFFVLTKCFFCDIISTLRKQPHIWRDIEAVITGEQAKKLRWSIFATRYRPKQGVFRAECTEAIENDYATAEGTGLENHVAKHCLIEYFTEGYRSGHNEAVLKTV